MFGLLACAVEVARVPPSISNSLRNDDHDAFFSLWFGVGLLAPAALLCGVSFAVAQTSQAIAQPISPALIESGQTLFLQDCAFCHGRDAGGGETGPDLTRSKLGR